MGRRCSPAWLHQASRSTQPAITTEITKHEERPSATFIEDAWIAGQQRATHRWKGLA